MNSKIIRKELAKKRVITPKVESFESFMIYSNNTRENENDSFVIRSNCRKMIYCDTKEMGAPLWLHIGTI